jgi:hypothetical protein
VAKKGTRDQGVGTSGEGFKIREKKELAAGNEEMARVTKVAK